MNIDVVIPAYRAGNTIAIVVGDLLSQAPIRRVVVVDDACPEHSGALIAAAFEGNARVSVLYQGVNQGVGGAVVAGYDNAFGNGADLVVKMDGDGQMRADRICHLVAPILRGQADYAKGNRFFFPRDLAAMPWPRLFGNSTLSLVSKFCSGYWSVMDPTNGFTALHREAYRRLEVQKIARNYFFESDMLYQLALVNAVVVDVPMPVIYEDEKSSLNIPRVMMQFPGQFLRRFVKRIAYKYFIREFNAGSLEIFAGLPLFFSGILLGLWNWIENALVGQPTPPGTIMVVALLIIIGFQLLLSALNYDIVHEPRRPLLDVAGSQAG